jgi:hypothetical protein
VGQAGREGVGFGVTEVKVLRHLLDMGPRGYFVTGPRNSGETSPPLIVLMVKPSGNEMM